jgi:hypothetical protein
VKRSDVIKLVALGAGIAAVYAFDESRQCRNERGEVVACRSSGSGGSGGGGSGSHSTTSRGGFGATGAGHGGGS